ncbi:MAG: hypothetical protein H6810_11250 [Phycisphaeraceae bacterium]|nr:MAG: hypothetical protein H6810_11250 [Phycisphaeraceae bacterium]
MTAQPASELLQGLDDPTGSHWDWQPQPEAQQLVEELLLVFLERCPDSAALGERIVSETGTHITDWVGVILTPDTPETRERLARAGYVPRTTEFVDEDIHYAFGQPVGVFPDILLTDSDRMSVGLRVECIPDFFAINQLKGFEFVQGEPFARARWAPIFRGERAALWVMERHGYDGYHLAFEPAENRIAAMHHLERFRTRARCFGNGCDGLADAERAVGAAADELGAHWAAALFMQAEYEYFVRSHCAATAQANRQHAIGLGLTNVDHLVYASSAMRLPRTLDLFAVLGFAARERVPLGAGDTAHILEQPVNRDVVAVVAPSEGSPGRAGSWTALLGESLLASGPAALALRGDPDELARQLGLHDPGTSKVAACPIPADTIEAAAADGLLDDGFARSLRTGGQIGPALTVLSRRDGFRGFTPEMLAWRTPGG